MLMTEMHQPGAHSCVFPVPTVDFLVSGFCKKDIELAYLNRKIMEFFYYQELVAPITN